MTAARKYPTDGFPVVCLGGSAGGLEAYQQILRHLPPDTGMAFVVISHRGTDHTGQLRRLLSHATDMAVVEISQGTRLEPNRVFLAPPRMEVTTDGVVLNLRPLSKQRGLPILIDIFLRSLAMRCAARSIAVILSGMGADGSLALQAIKDAGGVTFAQSDAQWNSMPQEAIGTGHVDFTLTAGEIGEHLASMSASAG